jgi:hypothetical protein
MSAALWPNLTKPANDQNYLRVHYTEFRPYWNIIVERRDRNSFTSLNKVRLIKARVSVTLVLTVPVSKNSGM